MIVCKVCGQHNDEGVSFCGNCGAFLEWEGERLEESAPVAVEPEAPAEKPGLVERVKQAVGLEQAPAEEAEVAPASGEAPAAAPAGEPQAVTPARPPRRSRSKAPSAATPPAAIAGETSAEAAGATTSTGSAAAGQAPPATPATPPTRPVEDGQPAARIPVARPPERVRPREVRPVVAPPVRRYNPGDLICGQCGTGNDPQRKFCRTCGNTLATAVVARVPWYRRIFRRRPKTYAAGERPLGMATGAQPGRRPRRRSPLGRILGIAFLLIFAVGLVGYAVLPGVRNTVNGAVGGVVDQVRRIVAPELTPVNPTGATATAQVGGHEAVRAIDGFTNTFWAADITTTPQPTLTLTFERPADIARVLITSGAAGNFEGQPRPRQIRLTFSDGSVSEIELRDEAEPQSHDVGARQVTSANVQVLSVYGGLEGSAVSITEIEFFTTD